ncbi:bacillithiol biosynthesis BshC [Candidatus Fermentibacterales bacterium]|nr:bacillithiol biosynthesis BshC [Candidatus Fermentibacterales bacterium]
MTGDGAGAGSLTGSVSFSLHPWFGPRSLLGMISDSHPLVSGSFPLFDTEAPLAPSSSGFTDRKALAGLLAATGERLGCPVEKGAVRSIAGGASLVLAGHQPVLLGGPLYNLFKALGTILLASRAGIAQAVPAFWIASEDHDILETDRCSLFGRRISSGAGPSRLERGRIPQVGSVDTSGSREPILRSISELVPQNDFRQWLLDLVSECDFRSFTSLFATLLRGVLESSGGRARQLVFIDAIDIRPLTSPVLASLVEMHPDLERELARGGEALRAAGLEPPLADLGFFEVDDSGFRRLCESRERGLLLPSARRALSPEEMACEIRERPRSFSPGAGLRCLVQDACVPVAAYLGGQAELLYGWQLDPVYRAAGIGRSMLCPRPSATLLEPSLLEKARRCGAASASDLLALARDGAAEPGRMGRGDDRSGFAAGLLEARAGLTELLDSIEHSGLGQGWIGKRRGSLEHNIDYIVRRLEDEQREKRGIAARDVESIRRAVLPGGSPQERATSVVEQLARFGPGLPDDLMEAFLPLEPGHVVLSPGTGHRAASPGTEGGDEH